MREVKSAIIMLAIGGEAGMSSLSWSNWGFGRKKPPKIVAHSSNICELRQMSRKTWHLGVAYRVLLMIIATPCWTQWCSRLVPCPFWSWPVLRTLKDFEINNGKTNYVRWALRTWKGKKRANKLWWTLGCLITFSWLYPQGGWWLCLIDLSQPSAW